MKNTNYKHIVIGIVIILVVYFIATNTVSTVDRSKYKAQIEMLEKKADSLEAFNKHIKVEVATLTGEIIKLNIELSLQDKKIVTLKGKLNEQIEIINNYSTSELQLFFTERYRQHLNTTKTGSSKTSY